jgi:hypothetical protein
MKVYLIILLLFFTLITYAQDYDLLLGLSYNREYVEDHVNFIPDETIEYATMWISSLNDSINVAAYISEIILPIDKSYFRMGIKRSYYNYWAEDLFWFLPIDEDPDVGISTRRGESCYGSDGTYINFIGEKYISISNFGSGRCYGGGSSSMWGDDYLIPIDELVNYDGPMKELSLFDLEISFYHLVDSNFINRFISEETSQEQPITKDKLWKTDFPQRADITHEKGQFFMDDISEYSSSSARGFIHTIVLDNDLPENNSVESIDTLLWNELQSQLPSATDIIISPDNKYAVITASDMIYMCKIHNNKIVLPAYDTHPVYGKEAKVIMYKWYSGKDRIKHSDNFVKFYYKVNTYADRIY